MDTSPVIPAMQTLTDPDKWDQVYRVWAEAAEQNDQRTADLTGIPKRTIAWHRKRDRWGSRFVSEHMQLSEADVGVARIAWRRLLQIGAERMEHILMAKAPVYDSRGKPIMITNDEGEDVPLMSWAASDKDAVSVYRTLVDAVIMRDADSTLGNSYIDVHPTSVRASANGHEPAEEPDYALLSARILEETQQHVNTRVLAKTRRGKRV